MKNMRQQFLKEVKPAQSYRGAGVAKLKLGNYEEAITYFNDALKCDKVGKALKKDILSYRAVAYLKVKDYEAALEDCQTLAETINGCGSVLPYGRNSIGHGFL